MKAEEWTSFYIGLQFKKVRTISWFPITQPVKHSKVNFWDRFPDDRLLADVSLRSADLT
jgi:hypothetical protein